MIPNVIMNVKSVAKLLHSQNNVIKKLNGEKVLYEDFKDLPEEMSESLLIAIQTYLNNAEITPEQMHNKWLATRASNGWVYGDVISYEAKTHPNMVTYDELPFNQKIKDLALLNVLKIIYST